jgi:hypothetical protein
LMTAAVSSVSLNWGMPGSCGFTPLRAQAYTGGRARVSAR